MKHALRFFVIAGLLLVVAGCGLKTPQPRFGIVETDTLLNCGGVRYAVQYRFATIANAQADPALKAIEEANIQYFFELEGFTGNAREALTEALHQLCEEVQSEGPMEEEPLTGEYIQQTTSEASVIDTLLVYTITSYSYTGGAHGMQGLSVHNYSLPGGYELTLADLFDSEQRAALDTLIRTKLYDRFGVSGDEGLAEQGFFPECIATTENFAVTPEGITFYYNPYDIGCYALGDVEVNVTREELETLRRE